MKLREKYDGIASISYDITDPIDVIITAVEDMQETGELVSKPYTDDQIVNLGHIMIRNYKIFHSDLCS